MSDLLIQGIQMPGPGQVIEFAWTDSGESVARLTPCFDDWHPVIVVQPHGRLIDVDDLEPDTEWDEYNDGYVSFSKLGIECAPTIILASE